MNAPINTPRAVADELLRVDQARRIRIMAARTEARLIWGPLSMQRDRIEEALEKLQSADALGAGVSSIVEACELALTDLQARIDQAMREVAVRHRLFANDDATEDFDDVDLDAILPVGELARTRRGGRSRG